jgi:DNA-binding transcriptional LysR family regulator
MNLRQVEYVVSVAEEGTFTAAADALSVSQPSLSSAVQALESELGVRLFHRTPRRAVLTAAGMAFVGPARQALRDLATARASVAAVVGLQAGHLDIVCLPTLAIHPVPVVIGAFRRRFPGVTVRVVEPEDSEGVSELVQNATCELGFAELPVTGPGLTSHQLGQEQYVALVPVALMRVLGGPSRLSFAALAQQPLVTSPRGTSSRRLIDDALAAHGLRAEVAVETDHREAIGPLVSAGAGLAIVPRALATSLRPGQFEIVDIYPPLTRRVGIIHRSGPLSPAAEAFLTIALGEVLSDV